ncbi:MAG: hypothetical protein R3C10_14675 [Pirellulales bacterium]
MMQIVDTTLSRLRYSTHARTLAELALVRLARLEDLAELSQAIALLASGQTAAVTPAQEKKRASKSPGSG